MGFSRFFIDRPIFAVVIATVITILGAICYTVLPIAQYPEVVPPTVQVTATYPGASAETVAETVAAPIEQGIDNSRRRVQPVVAVDGGRPPVDHCDVQARHEPRHGPDACPEPRGDRDPAPATRSAEARRRRQEDRA